MYTANEARYEKMVYRYCGKSGLRLPAISLGLWQNFGFGSVFENAEKMCHTAFDLGITHFDLANNYGPPYGEAESNFGQHFLRDWKPYRDELISSTKAGYDIELTRLVSENVGIPVIASGGAGTREHFYEAVTDGMADAALAASLFHYKELEISELKEYLRDRGVSVRLGWLL